MSEIPRFELGDIQGDFEQDPSDGAYIVTLKKGKLFDKKGRQVNRRGYISDGQGNVNTRKGKLVFYKSELD